MNYLITGATGFIGPHLIEKLTAEGHTCRCLVRAGSEQKVPQRKGVKIWTGDIARPETLRGVADGTECLLHLATLGHMSNFTVSEEMFYQVNVQGTLHIMREALRSGVRRMVHCSSTAAMGICSDVPATEDSPCNPHHPYGRSKLQAEKEVQHLTRSRGLPAVIVRFSMVYGPGENKDMLKLTRLAKKGFFPKIGTRPKLTPLIHVDDAVQGLLLAAEKGTPGEIFLLTNKRSENFDRLREIIQDALGLKKQAIYVPEWTALSMATLLETAFSALGKAPPVSRKNIQSTLADRVFSAEKAMRVLGFEPKVTPEVGLRDMVLWYRANKWL